MMQIKVTKRSLEQGFPCRACGTAVPASTLYGIRCPKCGQLYQATAEEAAPAPTIPAEHQA